MGFLARLFGFGDKKMERLAADAEARQWAAAQPPTPQAQRQKMARLAAEEEARQRADVQQATLLAPRQGVATSAQNSSGTELQSPQKTAGPSAGPDTGRPTSPFESNSQPVTPEERRWINPSAVTKLAAIVAQDAPRPPGDPIDFVITLYRAANPQMVAAFSSARPPPHIDAGYYHCVHIDPADARFPLEHLSELLDLCRYDRSRHSALLQPLTVARSSAPVPAAALLVTIYRSDSPNVVISMLPPMPIGA